MKCKCKNQVVKTVNSIERGAGKIVNRNILLSTIIHMKRQSYKYRVNGMR
jgi:hypothetical protein